MRSVEAGVYDNLNVEIDRSTADTIIQKICMDCDFYEKDCDFMQDRAAPPCGGMVILTQLLKANRVSFEEIAAANRTCGKRTGG